MNARIVLVAMVAGAVVSYGGHTTVVVKWNAGDVKFITREGMTQIHGAGLQAPPDAPGAPWLPARYIAVAIPAGAVATGVSVKGDEQLLVKDVLLLPVQPPQRRSAPRRPVVPPDPVAYAVDTRIPLTRAELCGTHEMRGYTFATIRLNVLRYHPAARTVWYSPRLEVTVSYREGASRPLLAAGRQPVFAHMAARWAVNAGELVQAAPNVHILGANVVDYLIITAQGLSNAFASLAAHREARGLRCAIETVESIANSYAGADIQQKIRACISNYVANRATTFVVLGGDDTIVPDRDCYAYCEGETELAMPTDLYYSDLNGTWNADGDTRYGETTDEVDMAPDVIVGRIPVRTAQQAADYITKVVAFENNRPRGLMEKMCIVGTETWNTYTGTARPADTLSDGHPEFRAANHPYVSDAEIWSRRMYRDVITQYWRATELKYFFDTLTSWDTSVAGDYLQTAANLQGKLSAGWGHVFFSDHGYESGWSLESGNYTTADASTLNNRVVLVYTDACLTGHFDGAPEPCFSEAILRNPVGGALVYLGCSRYGWGEPGSYYGGPSSDYAHRFYHRLFGVRSVAGGVAFAQHKADMIPLCGAYGAERWIQFGLNYQGDPAILFGQVETNQPPVLQTPAQRQLGLAGAPVQFTVRADDPTDADVITLRAQDVPEWAVFATVSNKGSVTGTFHGIAPQPTVADITFVASDKDGSTSATVRVVVGAAGVCSALFISEYGEGTGYNKYLELYNGTSNHIDLSGYSLRKQINGAGPYTNDLVLSGILTPGETYVIVYNQADAALREKADLLTSSACLAFNGNDAVALFARGRSDYQVDEVGIVNSPAYWGQDVTLIRTPHVTGPRVPYNAAEWEAYSADTWDDVGTHMVMPEPGLWATLGLAWLGARRRCGKARLG
ncbi:MAG: C25 family cysteine peptidase [bacterium]|nr:C25 family cysteine peptidase [bacterium]